MRVHHLNCATLCPLGGLLYNGCGPLFGRGRLICHCLLIETEDGLVLVDTGLGTGDIVDPRRLRYEFLIPWAPPLRREETAVHQVAALGFKPEDVRHIVLTHLDLDHAGGLGDFPKAKVHVMAAEHEAAMARRTWIEKRRYVPAQWAHGPDWAFHDAAAGERWFGFDSVTALKAGAAEVLLVPLIGHTRGHCGVAVNAGQGWLLHCGDAYFFHREMEQPPLCTPGLGFFQWMTEMDRKARLANQSRLRDLVNGRDQNVQVFCAHDPVELRQMQGSHRH
ncbi:MAG TPA: MBL fold metallo-hydrolase [Candidatus Cybelea sp.]|nr:MBL fold metallo-hydrolase [Candidatus Cybelea sp.]